MARIQTYSQKRAEELKILISTVKVKHNLTNAQLAKKIGLTLPTFTRMKRDTGELRQKTVWLLEMLAEQ